ncbi:MAG: MBL fold metallo-hydrolase [Chitinophagaceae bacterium]|jgi:glyoxylase-like metal-dependent hydrolase (beta-lactamase superfamily II)|nr:MBL fold metallo-hydrolase [Chitinophagaceae bacterium]
MNIIPLSEGSFTIDQGKEFIPFDTDSDRLSDRTRGSLLVEIQPFVVVTDDDVILLDAGLGFADDTGILQIHRNLVEAGLNPMDVTRVLMSHLHKDHAGGMSMSDGSGRRVPAFPMATYHVQRLEYETAMRGGSSSYRPESLAFLADSDRLVFHEGDGLIGDHIRYAMSGGHSPYHQVFWIESGGQQIFFGGDEAPQLHQMRHRFMAKYDHDGRRAMSLRQQWWEQGVSEGWTFLFYHDLKSPIVRAGA